MMPLCALCLQNNLFSNIMSGMNVWVIILVVAVVSKLGIVLNAFLVFHSLTYARICLIKAILGLMKVSITQGSP